MLTLQRVITRSERSRSGCRELKKGCGKKSKKLKGRENPQRMFNFFSFRLLRASGGCVLINILEQTRLLERGYVTRRNRVVVGMMEGGQGWRKVMVNFS